MTKDYLSDGVLVYDRYYCSKPHTPLLVIKRIILAVLFCVSSMMYILGQYDFPVSLPAMGLICVISCVVFSTILVFVRSRWLILGTAVVSGLAVWLNFGILKERLSYFADACMLLVEGRFLYPRSYLFHQDEPLNALNDQFVQGVVLGTVLLCVFYSFIVSLCFSGKLRLAVPGLLFVGLWVPVLISENLEFSMWLVPALASLAAAFAIRKNYSGGLAVKHSSSSDYRRRMRREERSFLKHISTAPLTKRTEMRCNYYLKYFSSGMYCAALVAICIMVGATIIPVGGSIDYTSVYEFVSNLGGEVTDVQSPFDNGTASEYFTHSGSEQENLLNIISPGRGEREMLHVTYDGSRPFYLRGDIGIEFTGRSWTTAVGSEPELWRNSDLKGNYRPCENRVISALLDASGEHIAASADGLPIITSSAVTIEYLCDTDVVFLPAYTADYSFYNNELFDVYSDYAVRVSEQAGSHINSVQCTALIPSYTSNEMHGDSEGFASMTEQFDLAGCTLNDIYSSVVTEMQQQDILSEYEEYVERTYVGIPEPYRSDIDAYISRELAEVRQFMDHYGESASETARYRYELATYVSDYLRLAYTYSLDGANNSSNPVMQFLNDTKRGHCSLYASAMTLILRELGVPARYCTGFYVQAPEGSNSVLLREKNLHAWVEVYVGEYGWVTFDPTSSAAYPDQNGASEAAATTENASYEATVNATSEEIIEPVSNAAPESVDVPTEEHNTTNAFQTSEANTSDEDPGINFIDAILPYLPASIVVIAVAAVLTALLIRLHKLKNNARESLNKLSRPAGDNSKAMFSLILALLEENNIIPRRGELPAAFWRRADLKFGTSLESISGLLEALEFGSHEPSPDEYSEIYAQLIKLVDEIAPFHFPGNIKALRIIQKAV